MNFLINHGSGIKTLGQFLKNSRLLSVVVFFMFSCFLVGCDYSDTKLKICNTREEGLYIINHNDTSLVSFPNALNAPYYKVEANKCEDYDTWNTTWETEVEMSKHKKLFLYVIKAEDLDSLGIRSKEFLDKKGKYERYSFTLDQLKKMKWKIKI